MHDSKITLLELVDVANKVEEESIQIKRFNGVVDIYFHSTSICLQTRNLPRMAVVRAGAEQ